MFNPVVKNQFIGIDEVNANLTSIIREKAFTLQANGLTKSKGYGLALIIDSRGGSAIAMERITQLMCSDLPKVHFSTLATGLCHSAAVALCASGKNGYRIAQRKTEFMVHMLQIKRQFEGSATEFRKMAARELEDHEEHERYYSALLASRSHKKASFWVERMTQERTYFTAAEALEWGLIDHVVDTYDQAIDLMLK